MTLAVMDFANRTLKSGKVVPGYGHAVLRETDPRYSCQVQCPVKTNPSPHALSAVSVNICLMAMERLLFVK